MLIPFDRNQTIEDWYLDAKPALITVHNVRTGAQIQEPSLAALSCGTTELSEKDLYTGQTRTVPHPIPEKLIAVGRAALEYQGRPDIVVFSPFRCGQITYFPAAQLLIKALFKQVKVSPLKPVVCIHIQEQTTQVEKQAIAEAAIIAGARKVFLYTDSLPFLLDNIHRFKELQGAVILHIETQD